jgi:hypothetical protein
VPGSEGWGIRRAAVRMPVIVQHLPGELRRMSKGGGFVAHCTGRQSPCCGAPRQKPRKQLSKCGITTKGHCISCEVTRKRQELLYPGSVVESTSHLLTGESTGATIFEPGEVLPGWSRDDKCAHATAECDRNRGYGAPIPPPNARYVSIYYVMCLYMLICLYRRPTPTPASPTWRHSGNATSPSRPRFVTKIFRTRVFSSDPAAPRSRPSRAKRLHRRPARANSRPVKTRSPFPGVSAAVAVSRPPPALPHDRNPGAPPLPHGP